MGTRHQQVVIAKNGKIKLSQYGQWDGYPSGQGKKILEFLLSADLNKYSAEVSKLKQITKKQIEVIEKTPNWSQQYPYLSRNCGANIHEMILNGDVKFVSLLSQDEANKWCEGFYTIDLQNQTFTAKYYSTIKTYSLNDLPTIEQFLGDFKQEE